MSAVTITAADRELALELTPETGNPLIDHVAQIGATAIKIAKWRERSPQGTLETILQKIVEHDRLNPDHGIGCACQDEHAWAIRAALSMAGIDTPETYKARANFRCVLSYIMR